MIKVFFNGLKSSENGNKLEKAWISKFSEGVIHVTNESYNFFSSEIKAQFNVVDNTNSMIDYFEKERFTVTPTHPMYNEFVRAIAQQDARAEARKQKRIEARLARRLAA